MKTKLNTLRIALSATTAIASGLLLALPVAAQSLPNPNGATIVTSGLSGGAPGSTNPTFTTTTTDANAHLRVDLKDNRTIIDWTNGFNIDPGNSVTFKDARAAIGVTGRTDNIAVLNRDISGNASTIGGLIKSDPNVGVYLINRNSIVFTNSGAVDVGSFYASTMNITNDNDFLNGSSSLRFSAPRNGQYLVTENATFTTRANGGTSGGKMGDLVLIAPFIQLGQLSRVTKINAIGGDVALVSANDVTIQSAVGSPLSLRINAGVTGGNGAFITGDANISARNVTAAGAFGQSLFDGGIAITGSITATGASATDRGIVLTMGAEAPGVTLASAPSSAPTAAIHPGGTVSVNWRDASSKLQTPRDLFIAGSQINLGVDPEAGGKVDLRGGAIFVNGVKGSELLLSGSSITAFGKLVSTVGDVTFAGPAAVDLRGGVDSARDIIGTSLKTFTTGNDVPFLAGRDISLKAETIWLGNPNTRAGRSIFLSDEIVGATNTYTLFFHTLVTGSGDITVHSRASISGYNIDSAGSLTLRGAGVQLYDAVSVGTTNIKSNTYDVLLNNLTTTGNDADIIIEAKGGVLYNTFSGVEFKPNFTSGRDIKIDSRNTVQFGSAIAERNISVHAGGALFTGIYGGTIIARNGFVDLLAGDNPASFDDGRITGFNTTAGTDVSVKGRAVVLNNVTGGTGSVSLASTRGDLRFETAVAGKGLTAIADGGELHARGSAIANGGDLLLTGNRISLGPSAPQSYKATGSATFRSLAGDFSVFGGATLQSNSDGVGAEALTVESNSSINLSNVSLLGGTARQSDVQIRNPANASVSLWNVSARNILSASGTNAFSTGLSRTSTVSLLGTLDLQGTLLVSANSLELGAAGSITIRSGDIDLRSSSNTFIRNRMAASGDVSVRTSQGVLVIQDTGSISGRDVVLSTPSNFGNFSGADAISAMGRWVIYSAGPADNAFGGLDSGNTALWGSTLATRAPGTISGNRYVFAYQPTLTFSTVDFSKIYGTNLTHSTTVPFDVSGYHPGISGAFLGDTAATAYSGSPLITSAGFAERATVAGGPYSQSIALGSLQSDAGYVLAVAPSSTGMVTVTPKALTATVTANDKTYDGTTTGSGNVVLSGVVTGDSVGTTAGTFAFADKNAGTDKTVNVSGITLNGTDSGNYTLTIPATVLADILKKALSGTITANNKTYDGTTDASGTVSLSGVIAGDEVATSGLTLHFGDKNAGTGKAVTASGALSGADAGNYSLGTLTGQADIAKRAITGTATANNKTYDGTTAGSGSVALDGVLTGDIVNGSATFTFTDKNAGTGKTVTVSGVTLSGLDSGNYSVTLPASALANIFKKEITGNVIVNVKTYDGTTAGSGGVTLNGVVAGDAVSATGTVLTYADKNAGNNKSVSVTGTTLAGADAGNYTLIIPQSVLGTIRQKAISANVTANGKTYDGTTGGSGTITLTGIVAGDTVGTAGTVFTFSDKNAGTGKTVAVSGTTLTGADAGNYTVTVPATVMADILRKAITGNVTANGKTYDGTTAASGTVTLNGVVVGDDVAISGTSFAFADKKAGTGKTVNVSGTTLAGVDAGNYTLSIPATVLADILKKALTGSVTANGKTYDGTTAGSGTVALDGVVAGDLVTGGATFTFSDKNAGTGKMVTVSGATLSGADAGNYTVTLPANAIADILRKALTGNVTVITKTYDGTTAGSGTVRLNGVVSGDTVGTAGTVFTFSDKNAGTGKTVGVSGTTLTGVDAGNYTLTVPASALGDILKKVLTGTVSADDKTYDGTTAAAGSVTVTGVVAGDEVNTSSLTLSFADKNAGTGKAVQINGAITGADASNYTLPALSGQADILRRAISGSVTAGSKTYDGTTAGSGSVSLSGVLAGDSVTGSATFTFSDKNAGTGKTVAVSGGALGGADAGNYTLTLPATTLADILKKALTASVTVDGKTYDGTTAGSGSVTLNGVVAGDAVGTTGTSFTFADKNAGTGKTVTIAGTALTGVDAGNYTLTVPASAVADIAKRQLTITADALEKNQGEVDPPLTFTVTGGSLVNGDELTGVLGREPGELPGDYAILLGTLSAGGNYQLTLQPGTFAIVARLSDAGELQAMKVVTLPAQIQDLSVPNGGVTVDEKDICGPDQACSVGN